LALERGHPGEIGSMSDNTALLEMLKKAQAAVDALSPGERAEMYRLQRESFVRGMMPWPDAKPPKMINGVLTYESYYDYCAD
jgi:hypothetical protein